MSSFVNKLLIGNVRVPVDATEDDILKKATDKMKRAGISTTSLHFRLYKKSIDARKKDDIRFVCTVLAEGSILESACSESRLKQCDARIFSEENLKPVYGDQPMNARPLVVGMGPAGLFAALLLARNGYAPVIIDRGAPVFERVRDVELFKQTGRLNTESNIQFGAGGAGTFSDGKLITRINDPRCGFVLKTLRDFGAPEDITVQAKPHIGTDLLRGVVSAILDEIAALGGEVIYHCKLEDFRECADGTVSVRTTLFERAFGAIILAPGHSARDTYLKLLEKNLVIEPKPISVGVRTEHLQADIDRAMFGSLAGHPNLGKAEYALSDTRSGRGVYTFCMCPGGEVVAAASEEERLVVNGMSDRARGGKNANAAVAVSVNCEDVAPKNGSKVLGMIQFQRDLEHAAYLAGGEAFYAPIMTLGDFLQGRRGSGRCSCRKGCQRGFVG